MPELSSIGSRLARRVVQDQGAIALSGASGTGLPLVSATCRVSRRKDRAGAARSAPQNAARGPGSSVGRIPGDLGGRNAARYTSVAGAGAQYAAYWTPQEVLQADEHRRAKQGGP